MEPTADPPTIIVVHPREKRRKCTVERLRGRNGFVFWKFPRRGQEPLGGYVRLGLGGPLLSSADRESGLLVLDGTWRLAARMEPSYFELPLRSLAPWQTAYPRTSKVSDDPTGGLATVEALFAALVQMGKPVAGVLDHYHWKREFLEFNRDHLQHYGCKDVG